MAKIKENPWMVYLLNRLNYKKQVLPYTSTVHYQPFQLNEDAANFLI
jgi:hypothetical protein